MIKAKLQHEGNLEKRNKSSLPVMQQQIQSTSNASNRSHTYIRSLMRYNYKDLVVYTISVAMELEETD